MAPFEVCSYLMMLCYEYRSARVAAHGAPCRLFRMPQAREEQAGHL